MTDEPRPLPPKNSFPYWANKMMTMCAKEYGHIVEANHPWVSFYYVPKNWLLDQDFEFLGDKKDEVHVPNYKVHRAELRFVVFDRNTGEMVAFTGVEETDTFYWYHSKR